MMGAANAVLATMLAVLAASAPIAPPPAVERWIMTRVDGGAVGFESTGVARETRSMVILTVAGYAKVPGKAPNGAAWSYVMSRVRLDCRRTRFKDLAVEHFNDAGERVHQRRKVRGAWQPLAEDATLETVRDAVCKDKRFPDAREAATFPDAMRVMKQIAG